MKRRIGFADCQKRLAILWLIASAALIVLMVAQSAERFDDHAQEVWEWLLPLIMPMLGLIVGALVAGARRGPSTATVDRFAYHVVFGLSLFYLALVAATPLVLGPSGRDLLEAMRFSNFWLGPLQGVVGTGMALFYESKTPGKGSDSP